MMNPSLVRWLAPILIGGCGVTGYVLGKARGSLEESGHGEQVAARRPPHAVLRERKPEPGHFENFESLLSADSRETDIWKVVSKLPAASIPEALRRLREAQAGASSGSMEAWRLDEIASALYFHWAESDPVAALADVSAQPKPLDHFADSPRNKLLKSVLAAWMRTDPNAAYRAVKDHKDFGYMGRNMLVSTWRPENVFENLKLFPDKRRDLLGWYCVGIAENEERRNAMLTALKEQPEMKDRDWANFMLFRSWGYRDFDKAMVEAETQKLPGTIKQLLSDNLSHNPAQAMRWALKNDIPPGGPQWEEGYSVWLMMDDAGARQWFGEQAPVWREKGRTDAVAGFLAQDFAGRGRTQDTANREAAGRQLVELIEDWRSKDPAAAAKWLDIAPAPARQLLLEKGAGSHE